MSQKHSWHIVLVFTIKMKNKVIYWNKNNNNNANIGTIVMST